MSIGHRITGAGLAGAIYAFAISASLWPVGSDTQSITQFITSTATAIPDPIFVAGKAVLAFPFTFHLFNGVRHLIWDAGWALTLRGVYATGWIVNGASVISTAILSLM